MTREEQRAAVEYLEVLDRLESEDEKLIAFYGAMKNGAVQLLEMIGYDVVQDVDSGSITLVKQQDDIEAIYREKGGEGTC